MNQIDSKKRFSDRVEDYVKYRPSYPKEIIIFIEKEGILTKSSIIADVGSGTGLLTQLFLQHGNKVYGVEPNQEMRNAGEEFLKQYPNFISVAGSSEETTLSDHSVDVITAGQAYHWFDKEKTKKEFSRILKPSAKSNIILIWNTRTENSSFNKELEKFIKKFSTDYEKVSHTEDQQKKESILFGVRFNKKIFDNSQKLDHDGLLGRLLSASYMLKKEDPKYPVFEKELKELFNKYQKNGHVIIEYETELYYGSV